MVSRQKPQKKDRSGGVKSATVTDETTAITRPPICLGTGLLINNKVQDLNATGEGGDIVRRDIKAVHIHARHSTGQNLKLKNHRSSSQTAAAPPEDCYRNSGRIGELEVQGRRIGGQPSPTTLPRRLPYFVECKVPHVLPQPPTFRFSDSSVLFQQIIRGEPCSFDISPSFHSERIVRSGVLAEGFKKGLFNPRNFAFAY
ncbi:hypothetical protein SprV_0200626000 [Sparganum proliferum]